MINNKKVVLVIFLISLFSINLISAFNFFGTDFGFNQEEVIGVGGNITYSGNFTYNTYNNTYNNSYYTNISNNSYYNLTGGDFYFNNFSGSFNSNFTGSYDNASWNETYANTLYTNQTYVDNINSTLYSWAEAIFMKFSDFVGNLAYTNESNTFSENQIFNKNITLNQDLILNSSKSKIRDSNDSINVYFEEGTLVVEG